MCMYVCGKSLAVGVLVDTTYPPHGRCSDVVWRCFETIQTRSIRTNAQHTAVVEQGCRAVAVMSEPSFTSRTRFFVENIQDTIHEVRRRVAQHSNVL